MPSDFWALCHRRAIVSGALRNRTFWVTFEQLLSKLAIRIWEHEDLWKHHIQGCPIKSPTSDQSHASRLLWYCVRLLAKRFGSSSQIEMSVLIRMRAIQRLRLLYKRYQEKPQRGLVIWLLGKSEDFWSVFGRWSAKVDGHFETGGAWGVEMIFMLSLENLRNARMEIYKAESAAELEKNQGESWLIAWRSEMKPSKASLSHQL